MVGICGGADFLVCAGRVTPRDPFTACWASTTACPVSLHSSVHSSLRYWSAIRFVDYIGGRHVMHAPGVRYPRLHPSCLRHLHTQTIDQIARIARTCTGLATTSTPSRPVGA